MKDNQIRGSYGRPKIPPNNKGLYDTDLFNLDLASTYCDLQLKKLGWTNGKKK